MLSPQDKQSILETIDSEGFDYAFAHYSDFLDIKDKEFHKAREQYLKARNELMKVIDYSE